MYLAHGPISFLANEIIQKKKIKKLNSNEHILIALASFFFGILPDFDLFVYSMLNIPTFMHHDFISHTPIFYIAIWILLKILVNPIHTLLNKRTGKTLNREFLHILVDTFLIATMGHLLADVLVTKIMLFYPLTDSKFTLLFRILEPSLFSGYFLSPIFFLELIFISIFTLVLYRTFLKENRFINALTKSFVVITTLLFPFSIYVLLNTYNRSYMYDQDGKIQYDADYDTLKDTLDMDIGNVGKDNITQAKAEDLLVSALDIINSKKWASSKDSKDLTTRLKYRFGVHDSYRVVSQAYYNVNLPIGPVLRDYAIKRDGFISYSYEYDYTELLFNYLEGNNMLMEIDLDQPPELEAGKIFFLTDNSNDILNLGITLGGTVVATVLEDDTYLQTHTLEEASQNYKDLFEKTYVQR